jgi:hypothetical protein
MIEGKDLQSVPGSKCEARQQLERPPRGSAEETRQRGCGSIQLNE